MDSDLKFFTNEPERDLYSKFQTLLRGNVNFLCLTHNGNF